MIKSMLKRLPKLEILEFRGLAKVGPSVLRNLYQCSSLKSLRISTYFRCNCMSLSTTKFSFLKHVSFQLSIDDEATSSEKEVKEDARSFCTLLSTCRQLRRLELQIKTRWRSVMDALKDASCCALEELDLEWECLNDCELEAILRWTPHLRLLNLTRCKEVSDVGLKAVSNFCPGLLCVSLSFTLISDEGLAHLSTCTRLQRLDAFCSNVKGFGLLQVAQTCLWLRDVTVGIDLEHSEAARLLKSRGCGVTFY